MTEKLRVGVIGTSWLVDQVHLPSLESRSQAEIAAICGRNEGRAREVAANHSIPAVFADYREMLEKAHLDAVVIASPDDLHYPMTMDALDRGLHVLCEKPLALNAAHAREMYERAEAAGAKHAVNFTWRGVPCFAFLRELVAEGFLGRVYDCEIRYLAGYARGGQYSWGVDPRRSQGPLAALGSHMIDLARLYIGEIDRVNAHLTAPVPTLGPDGSPMESANQSAMLTVVFSGGAHGVIHLSAVDHVAGHFQEFRVLLHGEAGTLEADLDLMTFRMEVRGARAAEQVYRALPVPERFWGGVTDRQDLLETVRIVGVVDGPFVDSVVNGSPIRPSFLDGLKAQEVIDAALRSHERGTWEVVGAQS